MLQESNRNAPASGVNRQLFKTAHKVRNEEDCRYCEMKRKFGLGSGDQKCFEHSVKKEFQTHDKSDELQQSEGCMNAGDMVEALEEVGEGLDYYWDNLRELSGGNPQVIHQELQPVLGCVRRIQQKLSRFFVNDNPLQVSEIKPFSEQSTLRKYQCSGSEKFVRPSVSHMIGIDDQSPTDSIKQWVMHFYKILQTRESTSAGYENEEEEQLPYEQQLEMRIFKQSLERKYLAFTNELQKNEKKLHEVLGKLIYYMEKSSNVPNEQIQQDIRFIEGQPLQQTKQVQLEKLLLLQASSIEHLLLQHNS